MTTTETGIRKLTPDERSEVLAKAVQQETNRGWRVASQTATQAQLVKGKPTNHLLHLILSIITLGVWLIVWILTVVFAGEKHRMLTVNEYGGISTS